MDFRRRAGALFRRMVARPLSRVVALPPVDPAPRVDSFAERQATALRIEGMMSAFSMAVMDAILEFQSQEDLHGNLVEFGVWRGRSACIVSGHVGAGERLILSDVNQLLTEQVLGCLYARPEFVLGASRDFRAGVDMRRLRGTVRFVHVDSGHSYRDTLAEMALVDELLSAGGVACLDDFTNLNYSQILPAVFKYLYTKRTDLVFFLVTNDKGYLCRRRFFDRYGGFVLNRLIQEMHDRGEGDVMLARTDADPEYRAFYLRNKEPGESDIRYGESLYGAFYKTP